MNQTQKRRKTQVCWSQLSSARLLRKFLQAYQGSHASNVDLYKRTSVDGEKHGSYEFSGEQFIKHISAAGNYLRSLLQEHSTQ